MSKRLLQRGRYPKGPGIEQYSNPSTQFVQPTFAQCPVTSEVSYFNPAQSQSTPNTWSHPAYPNPSIYPENQAPAVSESNAYWSSGQVQAQSNTSWSQPAENYSQNSQYFAYQQQQQQSNYLQLQQEQSNYSQQQQQPVSYVQQHESNYVQQQANYMQQQQSTVIQQPQSDYVQPQSDYVQQQSDYVKNQSDYVQQQPDYVQQQQSSYLQQNQHPIGSPGDTWKQNSNPQVENQTLVPQAYGPGSQQGYEMSSTQQSQSVNNNSSNSLVDTSLISWENGTLNVTEPAQLPWTYSAPQYSNSTSNFSYDIPLSTAPSSTIQSFMSSSVSTSSENFNPLPSDCQFSDSVKNNLGKVECSIAQSFNLDESKDDVASNSVPSIENSCIQKDFSVDAENGTSSLSAFFQNSDPNTSTNSECGETSTPEVRNNDSASIEESLSRLQIDESERNSVPTEDEQENRNLDDTDDGGNQEVNFIQESSDPVDTNALFDGQDSVSGFPEEPVNQEVPEPNVQLPSNLSLQVPLNQDSPELLLEEPLNQQIPMESSGQKSRSASRERERIVICAREESPFKPPRANGNLKGTVVQQEMAVKSVKENKSNEKTVVQEVNLETFPDNLERPPDYEELKKQSSFYASHQKHLRAELNNSPSSLLCDNPDIPCVTLAPAAPPIHSSAKSDKSESSSDSKREMTSIESLANSQNVAKEPIRSASSRFDSEFHEQPLKMTKSSSVRDLSEDMSRRSLNSVPLNASSNSVGVERSDPHLSQPYLRDSQIKEVRNVDSYRKPTPNTDNLQNPNVPPNYYSDYSSRVRPMESRFPPEMSRQKFADKKYPSFDERQYYPPRGGSRPPSRSSLDDRSEDSRYLSRSGDYYPGPEGGPQRDPARPPSRMSESDASRPDRRGQPDYYRDQYPYQGQYPQSQDYYHRPSNYRGYDYDPYQRDPYYASYYDAYRYAYSNYNYGFYDELYRNDSRYRQYHEQYRQYYAKYGYEGEFDRSSAHSGRSSANELSKDISSIPYLEPDLDSNTSEISAYNIHQDYTYDDVPNSSLSAADHSSTPSQRLTPVKFSYPHPIACFSAGGLLITAVPSQLNLSLAASVKIQSMQMIMENEDSYNELKNYQGPLIRGLTHKNDVIEFCNQKMKVMKSKEDVPDRDSYILLWELMILLLRQNGSVAGSDIAELLLKDHEILRPHAVPVRHNIDTPQSEQSPADVNDSSSQSHAGDTSSPDEGIVVLHDKTTLNMSKTVDVDKVTRKFREFLLFGHKKDALEWAMKHGLWGHALFLASKMDLRTYANVMTRFANSLALNDPLQTLYQLMSGRQPSAVTCVADKKWGDWRPHLAMILSNPSPMPDVDSRSITTLGDTLASRGCLPAAQFCYIMAQVEFGTFEQKNSKLVLLTGDHRLSFEEFASNEAIQCTEIYEYAQSLANPGYLLIHLQMYKFLYALRLVEHGFLEEALHYCEVIAGNLQTHASLFSYDLISEVFKLASRLKYHDPHFLRGQGEFEDQDDPEWLKNLAVLVQNYNNIVQRQNSEVKYEQPDLSQTINDQLSGANDNVGFENSAAPGIQADFSNPMNNVGYYQQNNWNQQSTAMPNNASFPNSNTPHEMYPYHQGDLQNNQSSYQMESKVPSHEENETTTDVPSSPPTQTPPFDYYSGNTQQEWNSVHPLPSVPLSDVSCCHLKSDLENLVKVEETESDVALCSSAHSTPLHNYLLSKDDSDDRQMLMNCSNNANTPALNSCLKSKYPHSNKNKKCIKFDASVSGHPSRLQRTGIRRRKFSKKKELTSQSDSSPEGSPSKEKNKSKLSILATLGIIKNDNSLKFAKRKRKAKKKNETIEKLLQSKKTFAIDEPCEPVNAKEDKAVTDSCQDSKKIIGILKKMSDDDKKNSELSQLMANEFNKKPPLIFGGTYPIDEPFESKRNHQLLKSLNKPCPDESVGDVPDPFKRSSCQGDKSQKQPRHSSEKSDSKVESIADTFTKLHHSENILAELSPLRMFKKMQMATKREILNKEKFEKLADSPRIISHSNNLKSKKSVNESVISENKYSGYDQVNNSYNSSSTHRERRDSALSSSSRYSAGNMSASRKPPVKETPKRETKPESKPSSQAGKTWLGGIFSRLLPKAPNQMILPDDKNPTIVWDEVTKRWVNKDSNDDDETNAPLAPPTDMELMGSKSSDMPVVPHTSSVPPAATSPVNKFQRPKTRAMRQNYVDILNNSGATTKTNIPPEALFPGPLEQTATASNMFVPQSASGMGENSPELENSNPSFSQGVQQQQQEQSQAVLSTPLMFDPAEFESRRANFSNQRHMIGRSGRRTYPT